MPTKQDFADHLERLNAEWTRVMRVGVDRNLMARISRRLQTAFDNWYGPDHPHSCELRGHLAAASSLTPYIGHREAEGLVGAIVEDIRSGWDIDYATEKRVETYEDLLQLATALCDEQPNGAWPAAVLTGAVLERHLVKVCLGRGIEVLRPDGKGKGISALNDALRAAGLYSKAQQREVQLWGDIRNPAIHCNDKEFEPAKVPEMIRGVQRFIENFPR